MIDLNELIKRIWKITWKHKILWGAGFLTLLVTFLFIPLMLAPLFLLLGSNDSYRMLDEAWPWVLLLCGFVFFMAASYVVSSILRPTLVVGVLKAERGAEKLSAGELVREAAAYFWRFLGLMLLFAAAFMAVYAVIMGIQIVASLLTFGLANLCLWPLTFLIYPLMYAAIAVMELAEASMVVDGLGIMESLRRAWDLVLKNKMSVLLVALILYVGLGIISSIIVFPIFMPIGFLPMLIAEDVLPRSFLWILGIGYLIALPIMAFVQGIVLTMIKTGWTLTYLRLSPVPPIENNTPILADEPQA
ncbi:MAG: hypothetical protein HYZ25_08635 [Chloroflexi bacterium]|nr:hypothetical protein [Chloroflexota bacterium]